MPSIKHHPINLENSPLVDAVLEVRFDHAVPPDAVYGMLYEILNTDFPENRALPVLEIPESIRKKDPNLRYQPWYELKADPFLVLLGPRVLVFRNSGKYAGWEKWSGLIHKHLPQLISSGAVKSVERIGLKYIDFFEQPILDEANVSLTVAGQTLDNNATLVRTEIADGEMIKVLQIANLMEINVNNKPRKGSVIDIDCIIHCHNETPSDFIENYKTRIDSAHLAAKTLFFDLIKGPILDKCKPVYE